MNTSTPETDKRIGIINNGSNVVDASWARQLEQERDEARKNINTSFRLFDLVRFMRAELHEQCLISDEEYSWLCSSAMATSKEGGSPSPRRLEEYGDCQDERDQLRKDVEFLKSKECEAAWCDRWKRLCEENTQLRRVCDEYYFALTDEQVNKAEDNYNSLPHVIAAKEGN